MSRRPLFALCMGFGTVTAAAMVLVACGGSATPSETQTPVSVVNQQPETLLVPLSTSNSGAVMTAPSSAPVAQPGAVKSLLDDAKTAMAAKRYEDAEGILARAFASAPAEDRSEVRYLQATLAAYRGRLEVSRTLLEQNLADAPGGEKAFWIHNQLTWVRWAQGNLPSALAEVTAAETAANTVPDKAKQDALKLHVLWDRAYLQLEGARTPADKQAAETTRKSFEALARKVNNLNGVEVLRAWFESANGKAPAAKAAVAKAKLEKTDDIQDVFVGGAALAKAGDPAGAEVYFKRVRESQAVYLMHALLLARVPPPPT